MKRIEKKKISVSVDARILDLASDILYDLGCSLNEAINIFLYQILYTQSIPFLSSYHPNLNGLNLICV